MRHEKDITAITPVELAQMGTETVAYLKKVDGSDAQEMFPQLADTQLAGDFWVLFAADGSPLMLADDRQAVFADAWEHNLTPVSVH